MSRRTSGMTLLELIAVVVVIVVVIGMLLPMLGGTHRYAPEMQSNTQLRGIHQSLVMYSDGTRGWYPGFDTDGDLLDATVEGRFQVLLDNNYFTGEYIVSPFESLTEWSTGPVTSANYSFAMLDIDPPSERMSEWRQTLNEHAIVMSDRNTGPDAHAHVASLKHPKPGAWEGSVAFNDNHVRWMTSHEQPDTQYGQAPINPLDNLFEDAGGNDALMIHTGD